MLRGYSVSSRQYVKLSLTSSPYITLLRSVFDGNSQNYSIFIIILLSNQVKHHYDGHMIFFWKFKTKMLLTMQEKTDLFFNYMICNFPSLLEILIGTLSNWFFFFGFFFNSFIGYVYKLKMNAYTRKETKNG